VDKLQQHMISAGYLKSWACPNPPAGKSGTIWVIQKDATDCRALKSPRKYFREEDRYTLKSGGTRNLSVENALNRVETWFGEALGNIVARKRLTGHDRAKLSFFTSAMMLRTRRIPTALTDHLRTIQMQSRKQETKANIDHSFSDAIDDVLLSAVGETVADGLTATAAMLIRMNVSIFVADDDAGFVTGDEPCSVVVPGAWNSYPTHPDVEIVLPLSPHYAALYSWRIPRMSYVTWDRKTVDRLNSRTIAQCTKEFVSWKGAVRAEWFPPDAA
jgi:Protein of unknown function (DUF4238)